MKQEFTSGSKARTNLLRSLKTWLLIYLTRLKETKFDPKSGITLVRLTIIQMELPSRRVDRRQTGVPFKPGTVWDRHPVWCKNGWVGWRVIRNSTRVQSRACKFITSLCRSRRLTLWRTGAQLKDILVYFGEVKNRLLIEGNLKTIVFYDRENTNEIIIKHKGT